jgi:SAM-dependent methyltransferase
MENDLFEYYEKRAGEYDRIYYKPERQQNLADLRALVTDELRGLDVLELACGTGYWTTAYASYANSVLATDISPASLEMARTKKMEDDKVSLAIADLHRLDDIEGIYTAVFAGFWWSHIPRVEIRSFLESLRQRFESGCRCVFIDNRYVEGSSTPISETDKDGNTYQIRPLQDGSQHTVLKNFPNRAELKAYGESVGIEVNVVELEYFWLLSFRLA